MIGSRRSPPPSHRWRGAIRRTDPINVLEFAPRDPQQIGPMRQVALASHVFVCIDGEYVVLLDLKRDRYWALETAQARSLAGIVRGWPIGADTGVSKAAAHECSDGVRLLAEKGLLCESIANGKDATPITVSSPTAELLSGQPGTPARLDPASALQFLFAATRTAAALRFGSLERVVVSARRRKLAHASQARAFDLERASELVAVFERMRPLLFSARDACLFNSLALIEFLAHHDLFPQWVFGVQARPFAAHCWIQRDGVVFDDSVEHVRRYTPIMAI